MAHVGLQDRQQRADVFAAGKPRPQVCVHLMAQMVHAGAAPWPAVRDAGLPEEPAEVLVDVPQHQRQVGRAAGEEQVPAGLPGHVRAVAGQPFAQRPGEGHLPVLAALGVADLQLGGRGSAPAYRYAGAPSQPAALGPAQAQGNGESSCGGAVANCSSRPLSVVPGW